MIATRFAVSLHILTLVARGPTEQSTSARLAWSIGTNPVVVRRLSGLLARAGPDHGAARPGRRQPSRARRAASACATSGARSIPSARKVLRVHARTNPACPVGQRLPDLLRARFEAAEAALLGDLASTTLADLVASHDADQLGHAPAANGPPANAA
jgi:DNA-binding IscR family transcriptional regulator